MIGGMVCIGFPIPEKVVYAYWEKKLIAFVKNCINRKKTMNLNQINFNVKGQHFNIADCLEK